jgi:hypothetical protein
MRPRNPEFTIYCGDAALYFKYGCKYRLRDFEEEFNKVLAPVREEFFVGLVIEDTSGKKFKVELKPTFVPYEEH